MCDCETQNKELQHRLGLALDLSTRSVLEGTRAMALAEPWPYTLTQTQTGPAAAAAASHHHQPAAAATAAAAGASAQTWPGVRGTTAAVAAASAAAAQTFAATAPPPARPAHLLSSAHLAAGAASLHATAAAPPAPPQPHDSKGLLRGGAALGGTWAAGGDGLAAVAHGRGLAGELLGQEIDSALERLRLLKRSAAQHEARLASALHAATHAPSPKPSPDLIPTAADTWRPRPPAADVAFGSRSGSGVPSGTGARAAAGLLGRSAFGLGGGLGVGVRESSNGGAGGGAAGGKGLTAAAAALLAAASRRATSEPSWLLQDMPEGAGEFLDRRGYDDGEAQTLHEDMVAAGLATGADEEEELLNLRFGQGERCPRDGTRLRGCECLTSVQFGQDEAWRVRGDGMSEGEGEPPDQSAVQGGMTQRG